MGSLYAVQQPCARLAHALARPAILVIATACGNVDLATDDAGPFASGPSSALPPAPLDAAPPDAEPLVYDCDDLPPGPLVTEVVDLAIASEDIAFDAEGHLVGADDFAIYKSALGAAPQVFVPNIQFRAGMRYLPNGYLALANDLLGALQVIDPDGVAETVLGDLSYPNGIAVGRDGYVYLTEHDAGRVRRIDSKTGENTILVDSFWNPNGITFNRDYDMLYIAGFSGQGTIYALPIDEEGNPGTLEPWATNVGSGYLDGMGVDACGNLYVCDYGNQGNTVVYRISPDGTEVELLIDKLPEPTATRYMPNLQWGSGIGGWDEMSLYLPDGWDHKVYKVEVGVPAKQRVYP